MTGRFLGVDPEVTVFNDPQSWNGYAYARNNPIVYRDPTGRYFDKPGDAANGAVETQRAAQRRADAEMMAQTWVAMPMGAPAATRP